MTILLTLPGRQPLSVPPHPRLVGQTALPQKIVPPATPSRAFTWSARTRSRRSTSLLVFFMDGGVTRPSWMVGSIAVYCHLDVTGVTRLT